MAKLSENEGVFNLVWKVIEELESRMFFGRMFHTATDECLIEQDGVTGREMLTGSLFCVDEC